MVLVVDDDADLGGIISDVIGSYGCRAIHARNGRDALTMLDQVRPSLMLIDLFMPIMNGSDFLKVVRKSRTLWSIPCALMTGANDPMLSVKEDVTVLFKPLELDTVEHLLRRYCDSPALPAVTA